MSDLRPYNDAELYIILGDLRLLMKDFPGVSDESKVFILGEIIEIKRELINRARPKDAA